jgi:hypothetical protein
VEAGAFLVELEQPWSSSVQVSDVPAVVGEVLGFF